jgi:GTPase Era involved in 16S rRNA processing
LKKNYQICQYDIPEGKKVAVLGRPNAGKSTFINKLLMKID